MYREPSRRTCGAALRARRSHQNNQRCFGLARNTKAVPGDVITKDLALKTGGDSRAELEFPDLTITRVGANALFRFLAGKRQIILDGGTMLFHAPKGAGGGKVETGAITAAVTGTDFLISNINKRVKGLPAVGNG